MVRENGVSHALKDSLREEPGTRMGVVIAGTSTTREREGP